MLVDSKFLKQIKASYYQIDRGGDITYHGPGQLVGYPILDLQLLQLSLKEYVYLIEEMVILTLKDYRIVASRIKGATGVWVDADKQNPRKICAIGIRASHFVTMHGFAFNINTDLSYFSHINPCGIVDKSVTSLSQELGRNIDMEEIKQKVFTCFRSLVSKQNAIQADSPQKTNREKR
jgi:lipoyl(octanoyl) transferase